MRENKPSPFVCTGALECMGAHLHACHSGAHDFPELRVYSRGPLGLVKLGFRFGCVGMRYVEVACVRTSLPHSFAQVAQSAWGIIRIKMPLI